MCLISAKHFKSKSNGYFFFVPNISHLIIKIVWQKKSNASRFIFSRIFVVGCLHVFVVEFSTLRNILCSWELGSVVKIFQCCKHSQKELKKGINEGQKCIFSKISLLFFFLERIIAEISDVIAKNLAEQGKSLPKIF